MPAKVLITGASGYLGGALIAQIRKTTLPAHGTIFALVRTEEQAAAVKKYGLEPLNFDIRDAKAIEKAVVDNGISAVFWLVDARTVSAQLQFMAALAKLKEATGQDVHFLHTSGAKVFSSLADAPTDRPLPDNAVDLYDIQKAQKAQNMFLQEAVNTSNTIVEQGATLGVRTYIFVPCIVYGEHEGFGNPVSIQTVAIVKAAKAAGRVYRVQDGRPTWPVSHVTDTANLYLAILHKILAGEDPGHGKSGYFLASSGSVAWDDIYAAFAKALMKRGVIESSDVALADDAALEKMAVGLGSPKGMVQMQLGGKCTMEARRGESIGWKSKYRPERILEAVDAEVELILKHV